MTKTTLSVTNFTAPHDPAGVVCFSGHRTYVAAPDDEARLAEAIAAARIEGYKTFVSGMAKGFDLAAAEAVVRLRSAHPDVRLIAAVPFTGQERGYSPAETNRYEALLKAADEVWILAERYSHGCYYRRDELMVERSDRLICWYDPSGASSGGGKKSGTGYTVRYALQSGLEVINIFRSPEGKLF